MVGLERNSSRLFRIILSYEISQLEVLSDSEPTRHILDGLSSKIQRTWVDVVLRDVAEVQV
jgi:hypothetical protein